ncbi:MAG: hypothetical protein HY512_01595 [Candidatus Aenigmarchaeota archaeon]|nr:hypothetical protein [Candidatus Aenigmarchaeota archaeon]
MSMSTTASDIGCVKLERTNVGGKVRLLEGYFRLAGDSAVFTRGKEYEVLGFDHGVQLRDDDGILRHISDMYLENFWRIKK